MQNQNALIGFFLGEVGAELSVGQHDVAGAFTVNVAAVIQQHELIILRPEQTLLEVHELGVGLVERLEAFIINAVRAVLQQGSAIHRTIAD